MGYNGKPTTYGCMALTGGTAGAVDKLPYASLIDGDRVLVIMSTEKHFIHRYDSSSSAAEASPNVIAPDDCGAGTGRWLLCTPGYPGVLYSSQTTTSTSGTGEDTLWTYTLPASTLYTNGEGVHVEAYGLITGTAGTHTIKLSIGATSYTVMAAFAGAGSWSLDAKFYRRNTTDCLSTSQCFTANALQTSQTGSGAMTWANANIIKLTGECSDGADVIHNQLVRVEMIPC
jgi:hypothetical protein